jgi:hypothetical protein
MALLVAGWLTLPATAASTPVTVIGPVVAVPFATITVLDVSCPAGKNVLGGGFAEVLADGTDKPADPALDHAFQAKADRPNVTGTGWTVTAWNAASSLTYAKTYARCA